MIADEQPSQFDWAAAKKRLREAAQSLETADQLTGEESMRLLDRRAVDLARVDESAAESDDLLQVISFQLGDQKVAIPTDYVMELRVLEFVTHIQRAADHFVGITNLSGSVTAIIDLSVLLEIPCHDQPAGKALVVGREEPEFGIAVDRVDHVQTLKRSELISPPVSPHRELMLGMTAAGMLIFAGDQLVESTSLYINEID